MPWGLERWHGGHDLHFITFSCYDRQPLLATAQRRDLLLEVLESVRRRYSWVVLAYVVMPEHVHLLVSEPAERPLSTAMQALKLGFARLFSSSQVWCALNHRTTQPLLLSHPHALGPGTLARRPEAGCRNRPHKRKRSRDLAHYNVATLRCTSRKYSAIRISNNPFTLSTIGAVNTGTSQPDRRFPMGIPPRNAQL